MAKKKKAAPKKSVDKKTVRTKPTAGKILPKKVAALPQAALPTPVAALPETTATGITLNVTFSNGLGSLTAKLFANGAVAGKQTINKSGAIIFDTAQTGNSISLNGNASGMALVEITRTTDPESPRNYAGPINETLDIL